MPMTFREEYEKAVAMEEAARKAVEDANQTGDKESQRQASEALATAKAHLDSRKSMIDRLEKTRAAITAKATAEETSHMQGQPEDQ